MRTLWFAMAICVAPAVSAQVFEEEVRKWSSKTGSSTFEAAVVGVEDGEVILRPPVELRRVPIDRLSAEDQAFVKKWAEENREVAELVRRARLVRAFQPPFMIAFAEGLFLHDKGELTPYAIANPEKIQFVGVYYVGGNTQDPFVEAMMKRYDNMTDRGNCDLVVLVRAENKEEYMSYLERYKVSVPVMEYNRAKGLGGNQIVADGFTKPEPVVPRLVVFDREGKIRADSYESEERPGELRKALREMEKLVRDAANAESAE